jgi:hypothetical protein
MEDQIFYPFEEKIRLNRVIVSILLIGVGDVFYSTRSIFYWYIYALVFFIIGIWYLFINLKSYFGRKPGIYLNDNGIFIKTSSSSTPNIKWRDIKAFQYFDKGPYSFISIVLLDNEKILLKTNFYERMIGRKLLQKYGSSITIVANFYNVSKKDLLSELNYRLDKYG